MHKSPLTKLKRNLDILMALWVIWMVIFVIVLATN